MKRAPSALLAIGGFGVAVATLSVTTTAGIVLLAPQPPAQRTSPAEALAALRGEAPDFTRRSSTEAPEGRRVRMVEGVIAAELGRPAADVRVVSLDDSWMESIRIPNGVIRRETMEGPPTAGAPGGAPSAVMVVGRQMFVSSRTSGSVGNLLLSLPFPAFSTSVREADGRWLTVEPAQPFLAGWQRNMLIALGVSLLLLAPLAWFFARRLTRPFRALAGALGDRAEAIPQAGPRELREAAAAIVTMRARLAEEAAERARMLTAIAHDLRTPLTGLRLRIEAAPDAPRARMAADIARMQAMIDEILTFARDAAAPSSRIELRGLLAEIVGDMAAETIRILPGAPAWIAVPEPAIRRVIENLVRNAVDYAGGGTIDVRREGQEVHLSLTDEGPGIPPADRERLLKPFERGDASRNRDTGGAGLGLSIVRDFAAQHRGSFTIENGVDGGMVALLRLPTS